MTLHAWTAFKPCAVSALRPIEDINRETYEAVHAGSNARSSTRKLGARLSQRRRALVDRFAKSRDGGSDHSVLSWAVPLMERVDKQLFFMTALVAFERAPIGA